ncbi:MAG: YabP/YqfC family sporulation protein [Clostridiales bacterium]|nr:YabP/YqfC family sporulation protein [Clostridiales bacterium]
MKNHENYPEESVEIFGKDTVFVEGFSKIIEYQSETVKIKYKKYSLRITGENLLLSNMYEKAVMITGTIFNLDFTE